MMAHGPARLNGLLHNDLFDGKMILGKLFLWFAVHHVVEVNKIEIGAIEVAVG